MFNPKEVADNLKRSGAFVPGIRPGQQTAKYIDGVLTRLTVFGSIYIALVCLLPEFLIVLVQRPFQPRRHLAADRGGRGDGFHGAGAVAPDVAPVRLADEEVQSEELRWCRGAPRRDKR